VTSHLFENEFRRAAPCVPGSEWGKGGEGWPDVSKCRSRDGALFEHPALACSSRRWLVLYARTPCRPVVEGQAQSDRAVSGSKFNERALRRAIRELRGTRGWSTSRVHVYVHT